MSFSTSPREVLISEKDLPFACPPPNAPKWNMHPRVYIQISAEQPVQSCPYCGARYRLKTETSNTKNNNDK